MWQCGDTKRGNVLGDGGVLEKNTGELMEYRHLIGNSRYRALWSKSYGNELGSLSRRMPGQVKGTATILFIDKAGIPADLWKEVTYGLIVVSYRPEKADPNRTRLTVGSDRVDCPGDCGIPTTYLLSDKLLLNSTIFMPGTHFITIDIKDVYLMTPMNRYKYKRLKIANLPKYVIQQYTLRDKVTKYGYVYLEIRQGLYGLPQAGILAQKQLEKMLNA